eukprot:CAMPEP_0178904374 /NCGR_PEP_ID=MMETSP0786-20121207/5665_1 /TAXON_ID=186022 /ORGANISM="Thalassionema frauenfeldii, Strain CCMP 1798" /LENGTH=176 /DNA_ID=CAMNT_0020575825 /DNA_START=21 /DNA_END=551 /DNA_ORIENTATION=-
MTEYKSSRVLPQAILQALCQLAPFFGCFFGIRGPDGQWPEAWWSLCFLPAAFGVFFSHLHWTPYKLVVEDEKIVAYNIWGIEVEGLAWSNIDSLDFKKNGCWYGNHLIVSLTESAYLARKECAGCCKCCVFKTFYLSLDNAEQFVDEYQKNVTNEPDVEEARDAEKEAENPDEMDA